jgi:hypothetical protein
MIGAGTTMEILSMIRHLVALLCFALVGTECCADDNFKVLAKADQTPLEGTQLLTLEGDLASQMVAGVDKFLLREIDKSVERRALEARFLLRRGLQQIAGAKPQAAGPYLGSVRSARPIRRPRAGGYHRSTRSGRPGREF